MSDYELRPRGVYSRITNSVITPADAEWAQYEAQLRAGVPPDAQQPLPPPPPAPFDFRAAGAARDERARAKKALTDPLLAAILSLEK
ncbi:MAG: hypothetical protein IPP91_11355 [Betaproteobacteria bacterium]|nr:hypothetical protein [Betaproteobacteria bacterium]